jgi:hypothetical protein
VLDTDSNTWSQPDVQGEAKPSARAGCCSALLGNRWYVLGGGNNAAGCPEMWCLDLVKLGVDALEWRQVSTFDARAPLASEGASLTAAPAYGALVAFGGYNGVFHNAVSVFKPAELTAKETNGEWVQRCAACSLLLRLFPLEGDVYVYCANKLEACFEIFSRSWSQYMAAYVSLGLLLH